QLRVVAVVESEPDRGNGFSDLAPRLMIHVDDLAASGLLGPGARAQYALMLRGNETQLAQLQAQLRPAGVRLVTPREARPEIRRALDRSGQFLDIAVLAATLLAAAAVALCAHQHGLRLRDEVALLKCLGASRGFIARALLLNLLLLGLGGGLAGAALGLGAQEMVVRLLGELLQIELPAPSLQPLLLGWGLGLLMLLGFAAPPILQAASVPPLRVFQRAAGGSALTGLIWLAATGTVLVLLWLQTGDPKLATAVLLGAVIALALLTALAWMLVLALSPLKRAVGTSWRFGLGNIARRRGATVAQVVALGLALLALLLVSVVRQDLLAAWQQRLPPDTPNQFLINIQPAQREALQAFFTERGYPDVRLWPMARARLTALNGRPVTADSFADPETQGWINRDFNLSWTTTLGDDNRITQGRWWGEAGRGQPWLSADEYAIKRLGLKLGDRMTLDFAGTPLELTVKSFRTVDWGSFRPNFFLLVPPEVVSDVNGQYIGSFFLPPQKRALLRELVTAFPNVTVLDIEAAMTQVRGMIDRVVRAVEFIFLFTLLAGLTVLLAAIEGTRAERVRETALLRTLGARSGTIARGLLAEYAVLGLLAGTVAAIVAQAVAWALAAQVFDIPYGLRPALWGIGAGSGMLLVAAMGWISLRGVLQTPPRQVLAGG
ncbi:MAG TPA: FtsX-like permease family protein, partial [Solimonas sp.]|nr:FtsX-like permease family protein [Solimonas sp.]